MQGNLFYLAMNAKKLATLVDVMKFLWIILLLLNLLTTGYLTFMGPFLTSHGNTDTFDPDSWIEVCSFFPYETLGL